MPNDLPDKLREYLKTKNTDLGERADNFWKVAQPILDRQSSVNSNENGLAHVSKVELNIWRLIKESDRISAFSEYDLFILSCAACSHDFDKGLFKELPEGTVHGEASGDFLLHNYRELQSSYPEMVAIEQIIGIHALPPEDFQNKLNNIQPQYPLATGPVALQKLAVILKTADILHTDHSRIASIGIDTSIMDDKERKKHFARESITGWMIDGTRIILNATPRTLEHQEAVKGCRDYMMKDEWPAVEGKLSAYDFPHTLQFKISLPPGQKITSDCEKPTKGKKYSKENYIFNVPYREKGDGVLGRKEALTLLREQLTKSRGTAIGQTASFNGIGGLGKTQLAVEYAHRYKDDYPNGVIWINADQEIKPQLIQISQRANWIAPESEHQLILEVVQARLKTFSNCLIIFDNVEVQEDIEPYFPEPSAQPHLILTSRRTQPGFEPIALDVLDKKISLDLFMMESGRIFDSIPLEEQNAAQKIVEELGGLPLAIELAGAFIKYSGSFSFVNYHALLKESLTSAMPGKLAGFTGHEADLYKTLKVSGSVFKQAPLLKDILDVLTWSGSSFMGISLLSDILNVKAHELFHPLSLGTELRLLKKDENQDRYEIHRLLRTVRQEEFILKENEEWAESICSRVGSWFESRRVNFANLPEYETEIDNLKKWHQNAASIGSLHASRLLWLQAYPLYHWGNYQDAFELVQAALDEYGKSSEQDRELKAHLLNDLGYTYRALGDYDKALEFTQCALKIREDQLGPEHPDTATSLNNVGAAYGKLCDYDKALKFYQRALKIREDQLGPEHPDTATPLNNVGAAYGSLGDYDKALEFYQRALKIREDQLGPEHPDTANALNNVGTAYGELGNYDKELKFYQRALKIREDQLGPEHPDTATSLNNVGSAYGELGNYDKALKFYQRALKISEDQLGPEHPDTATSLNNVGFTHGHLGDYDKALEFYQRDLKISEDQLGPEHPNTAISLRNIIIIFTKKKKFLEAHKLLVRFLKIIPKSHSQHNVLISMQDDIARQSKKSGFRTPAAILRSQNRKGRKNKGKRK